MSEQKQPYDHLAHLRAYRAQQVSDYKAAGICIDCGVQPSSIGKRGRPVLRCETCNDKVIERAKRWKHARKAQP